MRPPPIFNSPTSAHGIEKVRPYTGLATIYVCHCWGGRWGDLVAACVTGARDDRFLFLDLFAIRQWPGNNADMDYREVSL
jgi:hypothetical protein